MTSYYAYSFEIADNDTVTSVNQQNLPIELWTGDNLYPELAAAGYPLTSDPGLGAPAVLPGPHEREGGCLVHGGGAGRDGDAGRGRGSVPALVPAQHPGVVA